MFSVLILTLNEEKNIAACIASAGTCDDVVVLDSGSMDGTVALAESLGARVFTRAFDTFAGQRNFAHTSISFKHSWVFHLDADERMTPELIKECAEVGGSASSDTDGFFVAPRMLWKGFWVPRSTDYPAYQARFVHATRFRFVQAGHGQREDPAMHMGALHSNYRHEMCGDGVEAWLEKHRKYARQEARLHWQTADDVSLRARELFSRNSLVRRRALKRLSYRLPARPLMRLIYQYILRCGFLDGRAGFEYCRLLARYEGFAAHERGLLEKKGRTGSP